MKNKKGFTLVELIVVLAILAVLLVIAVPVAFGSLERAKDKAVTASISNIKGAVDAAHGLTYIAPELRAEFGKEQIAILHYINKTFVKSGPATGDYAGKAFEDFYFKTMTESAIQVEKNAYFAITVKEHHEKNVYELYITYSKEGYTGDPSTESGRLLLKPKYPYYQFSSADGLYRKFKSAGDTGEIIK